MRYLDPPAFVVKLDLPPNLSGGVRAGVAADELPNLPHGDLAQIGRFAQAKIREAVLASRAGETSDGFPLRP
jgi:hypothetical protein